MFLKKFLLSEESIFFVFPPITFGLCLLSFSLVTVYIDFLHLITMYQQPTKKYIEMISLRFLFFLSLPYPIRNNS